MEKEEVRCRRTRPRVACAAAKGARSGEIGRAKAEVGAEMGLRSGRGHAEVSPAAPRPPWRPTRGTLLATWRAAVAPPASAEGWRVRAEGCGGAGGRGGGGAGCGGATSATTYRALCTSSVPGAVTSTSLAAEMAVPRSVALRMHCSTACRQARATRIVAGGPRTKSMSQSRCVASTLTHDAQKHRNQRAAWRGMVGLAGEGRPVEAARMRPRHASQMLSGALRGCMERPGPRKAAGGQMGRGRPTG